MSSLSVPEASRKLGQHARLAESILLLFAEAEGNTSCAMTESKIQS